MLKKILSILTTIALLMSRFQGIITFADVSGYTQILNCDFEDSNFDQVEKFEGMLYDLTNGQYQVVNNTSLGYYEDNTYSIGMYYKNTITNRIVKFDQPINRADDKYINHYLEVEYDIRSFANLNPDLSPASAGAASVVLGVRGDDGKYQSFSGIELNNTGYIYKFWARNVNFGTFTNNDWIRCKFVMLLNNNGTVTRDSNFAYYINGQLMGTGGDYHGSAENPLTIIDGLRLYSSSASFGIDNLKVSIYPAGSAPVEKGELVWKIREFEKNYGDVSDNLEAYELLQSAKHVYENDSSTAQDVAKALNDIANAKALVNTDITEIISFDFETKENQQAFRDGLAANSENGGNVSFPTDDTTFGIGTCVHNGVSHNNYTFETPFDRNAASSKNLYLEAEFDFMPISVNAQKESLGAVTFISGGKNNYKHFGGIQFYYNSASENSGYLTAFWRPSKRLMKYEFGKWYRCKMVVLLNDNGVLNNTGVINYYINGEKILTDDVYTKDIQAIECLRLYASNSSFRVDNISVKSYKKNNVPVEKGKLVTELRNFTSKYMNYSETPDVKALIDSAAAVYYNKDAKAEDVEAALADIKAAENLVFPANVQVKQDFEQSPSYFFDSIVSGGIKTDYVEGSDKPEVIAYNTDATYGINNALYFAPVCNATIPGKIVKNIGPANMGEDSFISIYFDVKNTNADMEIYLSSGDIKVAGIIVDGENIRYLNNGVSSMSEIKNTFADWTRLRFDVNFAEKTYNAYINGELAVRGALLNQAVNSISSLELITSSNGNVIGLDNVIVINYDVAEYNTPNKGKLIKSLRIAKELLVSSTMSEEEKDILQKAFDKATQVYDLDMPTVNNIIKSEEKIRFLIQNLTADIPGARQIIIPGAGVDLENVVVQFNLHYGSQTGDISYKELFFDKQCNKDFSDVKFLNYKGEVLDSEIVSTGNYDFISDGNLGIQAFNLNLSDGTIVSVKDGYIAFSHDNAATWQKTSFKGRLYFVDRNDNIYYAVTSGSNAGMHKLRASENYANSILVIDCSDAVEQGCTEITWGRMVQDDDGYIYAGRYTEEWIGAALYVSDESGENFRIVDFRADKQHCHTITINRNVYPNEVYVTYDDSSQQPLCQVTIDHAGYEAIKNDPDFMHPTAARSTGTEGENKKRPANEVAEKLLSHSKKHFVQVPIPFANSDYFGYFGVIDKSEDKFYTASNGKRYTTKDNVYALGFGEANILGGPGLYKTTDIMNPDKYYAVIENAQGSRTIMSPAENVLLWGGLAGRYCMTPQICLSYDDGETWFTAYSEGYNYSGGAGNGPFRMISAPFVPKGSDEEQILMAGWGHSNSMRAKFGEEYGYGFTYVNIDKLPAEGMKIFVTLDKNHGKEIISYEYSTLSSSDKLAIKSIKSLEGEGYAVKFPTPVYGTDTKGVIYCFDVHTENKTAVAVNLIATNGIVTDSALSLVFRTDSGKIYNFESDSLVGESEDLKLTRFSVKLVADYLAHSCDVYINGVLTAENVKLGGLLNKPVEIAMHILDLSSQSVKEALKSNDCDTASSDKPIVVYYSDVSYAEVLNNTVQFLISGISYKDSQGNPVSKLGKGVTIESITIEKIDAEIDSSVLIIAFYSPENKLINCRTISVSGSGTYNVGLTAMSDDITSKIIMVKNLQTIQPLTLISCME